MNRRTFNKLSGLTTISALEGNADLSEEQSVPPSEVVLEDETVLAAFDCAFDCTVPYSCNTPLSSIQAPSTHESRAQHRSAFHLAVE